MVDIKLWKPTPGTHARARTHTHTHNHCDGLHSNTRPAPHVPKYHIHTHSLPLVCLTPSLTQLNTSNLGINLSNIFTNKTYTHGHKNSQKYIITETVLFSRNLQYLFHANYLSSTQTPGICSTLAVHTNSRNMQYLGCPHKLQEYAVPQLSRQTPGICGSLAVHTNSRNMQYHNCSH